MSINAIWADIKDLGPLVVDVKFRLPVFMMEGSLVKNVEIL